MIRNCHSCKFFVPEDHICDAMATLFLDHESLHKRCSAWEAIDGQSS
jgi:hypothetical protein